MTGFKNRNRAKQLISFENMKRRGGLTPTDIDGFQEYGGKLFLYFEGKYGGKTMESAQSWAFASICESYHEENVEPKDLKQVAWVLVFNHDVHDTEEDVVAKDQYVTNVISSVYPEWRVPESPEVVPKFELVDGKLTLLDAIIQIENWCHENNIKIGK